MFTKIREFINNNKPVRNCKLQSALKEKESWAKFALVLHDYLGDNVVEILENGHADKIAIKDGLVIIGSGAHINRIELLGNSRFIIWPGSKGAVIEFVVSEDEKALPVKFN